GSISNEHTFMADVADRASIDAQLRALTERVVWRARKRKLMARTVTLKLRYANFQTLTRSRTNPATDQERVVLATVRDLLDHVLVGQRAVRLLGVGLTHLVPHQTQLGLPFAGTASQDDRRAQLSSAVDTVRQRFGYDAIRLGVTKQPGQ
ncbi:MAG: DNA polymerase IV, partial [Oligoflexia bacterium]|nr:DNA polymerase IV [Oligoflexia bacterium]